MDNIYVIKIKNLETGEEFLYSSFLKKENCLNAIDQIKNFRGQNFIAIGEELDFTYLELQMAVENEEEKNFIEENIDVTYEEVAIEDSLIKENNNSNNKKTIEEIKIADAIQKLINGEIEIEQLFYQYDRKFEPISSIDIFGENIQLTDSQDYEITTINKNDIVYIIK